MYGLIKIGEMAKLFGLNIRTLRYYDEIGLLKPACTDPDTGYRYYCVGQFEQLNVIRYLKAQGMPLEDIGRVLEHRDPLEIQKLLIRQREQVERQIQELQQRLVRLENRIRQIDRTMDPACMHTLRLCRMQERPCVSLDLRLRGGDDLEMHLRTLENRKGLSPSFFLGKVGLSMPLKNLKNRKLDQYHGLFCLVEPGELETEPTQILPAGLWAQWRFSGTHKDAPDHYRRMLEHLERQGMVPAGDAAEFALLDAGLTDRPEEYTTEIQIPVDFI